MTADKPDCTCGHPEADHYELQCVDCGKELVSGKTWDTCQCPDDGTRDYYDGCKGNDWQCFCGGFVKAKPPVPEPVDPNQTALFTA
jgi:hypothetical protein